MEENNVSKTEPDKDCFSYKDILAVSYQYFVQHANQRVNYLHSFILFSTFITAAIMAALNINTIPVLVIGLFLGLLQLYVSYISYKIDDRNKFLTKMGENAIKTLEKKYPSIESGETPNGERSCADLRIRIFTLEEEETKKLKEAKSKFPHNYMSHSKAFNRLYAGFGLLGVVEAAICMVLVFI